MNVKEAIEILKDENRDICYGTTLADEATKLAVDELERSRWIPVSERLPTETKAVLIFTNWDDESSTENYVRQATFGNGIWLDVDENTEENITHWMPLPEHPGVE